MESLSLSVDDLCHHVVTFGVDVYPPVEIPSERTRLNMFHEEARERWKKLFDRLIQSETEFRISKGFRKHPEVAGPSTTVDTFVLTNRGPVFVFPLILPEPVGPTGLESSYLDDFRRLLGLLFDAVTKRAVMRIGLIRELVFATGTTTCQGLITDQSSFANAKLVGGRAEFKFRDDKYNHNLLVEPVTITRTTQLAVGIRVDEPAGYGVRVRLDVNNSDVQRPLDDAEIQGVLDRASSLWPDKLLEFVRELPGGRPS